MTKKYKFYSDSGHGWLAVKRSELIELGIIGEISCYSYQKGQTVYLEEDRDAVTFCREKGWLTREAFSENTIYKYASSGRSPIRSYECFSSEGVDK